MRFCLFGKVEGIHSDSPQTLWASVKDAEVTDASVSARKRGVRPGMTETSAKALVPELQICPKEAQPTEGMQRVWKTLWSHTPWLQTLGDDSFWIQLPAEASSFQETKQLLLQLDEVLGNERRIRLGMAESPLLARAIVAWSRLERVPDALYRRVGQQQWIISPGLWSTARSESLVGSSDWIQRLPIQSLWMLDEAIRAKLLQLGIQRFMDLTAIQNKELEHHFGKEARLWKHLNAQFWGGQLMVNYPPLDARVSWCSSVGEAVPVEAVYPLLEALVQSLSSDLERQGIGALRVGMAWTTDVGAGQEERLAKRPLVQATALLVPLSQVAKRCQGRLLEQLEVWVTDLRPLHAVQTSFVLHGTLLLPFDSLSKDELKKVLSQVNRKYPRSVWVGVRPRFRELRLEALSPNN